MSLTREEVLNVAKLARLEFKLEEIEKFQNELNDIIKYIDVLSEVNTDNVEPLTQVNDGVNNFREDKIKPSISVADAILNAPSSEDGAIIVPKVVGE